MSRSSNWRNGLDTDKDAEIGDILDQNRKKIGFTSVEPPKELLSGSFNFSFDKSLFLSNQQQSPIPSPEPRLPPESLSLTSSIWNRTVEEELAAKKRNEYRSQSSSTSYLPKSDLSSTSSIFLPTNFIPQAPTSPPQRNLALPPMILPQFTDSHASTLHNFPDAHTSLIGPSISNQYISSPSNSPPPPTRRKRGSESAKSLPSGLPSVPAHSPWAMWAGNVPADASKEELWRFFAGREENIEGSSGLDGRGNGNGVESVHLIQRSNCAFINYHSSAALSFAIATKHGISLRPLDRRCKTLVCRVRMREDDAKSGVGAQRGGGMHRNYVKEKALLGGKSGKGKAVVDGVSGEDEDGSGGSTSESLLEREFPKRYFILKSHNEEDLLESTRTGTWATQSHNEVVLDLAFRTSKEGVYLIFSANRSGEWYGYARMSGPIFPTLSEETQELSPLVSALPSNGPDPIPKQEGDNFMNGYDNRASTVQKDDEYMLEFDSRPAPSRNVIEDNDAQSIGQPFPIEWIKAQKLPFLRTKNILNSFNSNREIKISRDGTELEPKAGEFLLMEFWRKVGKS